MCSPRTLLAASITNFPSSVLPRRDSVAPMSAPGIAKTTTSLGLTASPISAHSTPIRSASSSSSGLAGERAPNVNACPLAAHARASPPPIFPEPITAMLVMSSFLLILISRAFGPSTYNRRRSRTGGTRMRRGALTVGMVPVLLAANAVAGGATPARASLTSVDTLGHVGRPATDFPPHNQNEPAVSVAIDPSHPNVVVSGSNDEIDNAPCAGTNCSFTPGVSDNGVYFSFNGGRSYTEPTYTGWSARTGTGTVGPIGTVPGYYEKGIVGEGDPALAFGPRPGPQGFSWTNGSRLYYASLASNFPNSTTIKGGEAIAVARTDHVAAAAGSGQSAWMAPVIASKDLTSITFSDKET